MKGACMRIARLLTKEQHHGFGCKINHTAPLPSHNITCPYTRCDTSTRTHTRWSRTSTSSSAFCMILRDCAVGMPVEPRNTFNATIANVPLSRVKLPR